jgi:hypothetical protein
MALYCIFADNLKMAFNFTSILQNELTGKSSFTKDDLVKVLSAYIDNPKTIAWRIHDLKEKGIIHNIQRGVYSWSGKTQYVPEISEKIKTIQRRIQQQLPYTNFCIAETRWLNEFMRHQVFKSYLVIEIEKEATAKIYNSLKDGGENAFLTPDAFVFETYISITENALIVKPLISESPLQLVEQVQVPTLEKMLVDIISDKEIYNAQETEAADIFKMAAEKYNINERKLMRYARRRNKATEINNYYHISL